MNSNINIEKVRDICIKNVKISEIRDNVLRLDYYCQSHIEELSKSIERDGLVEPLIVHEEISTGNLTILNGHYRIRALRRLKFKEITCRVLKSDFKTAIEYYCTTFFVKSTLSALEEGYVILHLISNGYTLESAGALCGKSSSWACRRVNLVKRLDKDVKEDLIQGKIMPRTAQEIARLPQGNEQKRVAEIVNKNKLTKDETAKLIDKWLQSTEDERNAIEKEFIKDSFVAANIFITSPENSLKNAVNQSMKAVSNLVGYVLQMKSPQEIWRNREFGELCDAIRELMKITIKK